ncbi:MAG: chromosome segregation protein SMC [Planctomycetota bacterium]
MTVAPAKASPTSNADQGSAEASSAVAVGLIAETLVDAAGTAASVSPTGGLRLVSLTLHGFKSFADKTSFTFDDPITGVVGPNGCGKSNLVDAIKWVLGERSSKSLRGKEMIDVIFAGSAGRKPGGMASVTLTFSNPENTQAPNTEATPTHEASPNTGPVEIEAEDVEAVAEGDENIGEVMLDRRRVRRPLPIDAEEVAVERQLYRDGTSRYLINGKRARLRDIRELFMDTGIGADAYSIIEQGKVDAMLLASPQERRTIFEEAAGVAKYKVRRIEASRKLERAETNLVRTRDQLESTERRLKTVRTQAAKARRFQELDDESRALKLAVAFQQYDEVRLKLEGLTSQLQMLAGERDATQRAVTELESDKREADAARAESEGELRRLERAAAEARHRSEQAEQRATMAARSIEEANKAIETETARHAEAQKVVSDLASDASDAAEQLAALSEKLADAERSLETLNAQRSSASQRAASARRDLAEARTTLEKIERDRARVEAQAEARRREREQLSGREAKLASRRDELETTLKAVGQRISDTERLSAAAGQRITGAERSASELAERAGTLADDRSEQVEALNGLERELAAADAKRATLDELVRTRAGLGEAAKAALERRDAGEGFAGVVAPLAELIEADTEHASLVEAALGDLLDALIVRTPGEMPTREELDALPGRVRLAVLAETGSGDEGMADADAVLLSARVHRVRSIVRTKADAPAGLAELLDRVLGSCLAVGDLDAAHMLRASGLTRARFVTSSGETLDTDGTMTVGPRSVSGETGVLARAAALQELETRVDALTTHVESERSRLAATDARLAAVQGERGAAERELADAKSVAAKLASTLERERAELARNERDLKSVREETDELSAQGETIGAQLTELTDRARKFDGLAGEHRQAVATHEATASEAEADAERAGDALAKARVEVGRLGEQTSASRREARRLETEVETAKRRASEHERHVAEATERRDRHSETVNAAEAERESSRVQAAQMAEAASGLGDTVKAASERVEAIGSELGKARDRARLVERDWNGIEGTRREQEVRREHLEERAHEDIGIDLAGEYVDYRVVVAPGDVAPVDVPDSQARINVLKSEIKKLGNVNIDAIAEEDTLAEKNEELVAQLADIDEARARLVELIETLNEASKARFGEVFARIQGHFGGQDGMFRKLFGGGRAEVRLMPLIKEVDGQKVQTDEVDLLESGIEVIAKPPGKEPRSISQLSGGEKTLTAVALLMSIFRSKPSCFCVLDEVDAALDEANVARFGGVIREFTSFSRFIVITHNKRTMQICDHMYGVTQRERGVSSRVSVKFDQVGKDGSVSAEALKSPPPEPEPKKQELPSAALRKTLGRMRKGEGPVEVSADG